MRYFKVLSHELVLSSNVVIKSASRPLSVNGVIRGRSRLAVAEQCGDDDEVLIWVERLVFSDEPKVIRNNLRSLISILLAS
jgi:hypothetical protein